MMMIIGHGAYSNVFESSLVSFESSLVSYEHQEPVFSAALSSFTSWRIM